MAVSSAPSPRPVAAVRSQALDDLIMGTNSSSIVSKRSVERLYYPDEPPFFRYFVNKFQRRAPLINRGYWLRLRAIDVIVRQFIEQDTSKTKVVINLGCGSDVLPWQCHTRYGASNGNLLFVDVDYPDLMRKKRAIVLETPQLRDLLGADFTVSETDEDPLLLRSDKYCQLACDLRRLDAFRTCLESFLNLSECCVLFVAEVSVTYMDTDSADALIQWASSIGQAEFCLLEQILPHGPDHPFAQTMLRHFDKLSTPPRSVGQYPTLETQANRFKTHGWLHVDIWDLWQAWSSDLFVSNSERTALDEVEPFDEWEEFILFARHYFILHASAAKPSDSAAPADGQDHPSVSGESQAQVDVEIASEPTLKAPRRRFGGAMVVTNIMGQRYALHMMGLDTNGRTAACDIFSLNGDGFPPVLPLNGPLPRVNYTLTDLGDFGTLLVGGRTSPACALSDCWLFEKGASCRWQAMPRLPIPLFRHSAIRLGGSLVLVIGGKTGPSHISGDCFVFHPERGWLTCEISGPRPEPSFGSVVCNSADPSIKAGIFHGLLAGGINRCGRIVTDKYMWRVDTTGAQPIITFTNLKTDAEGDALSLFGANVVDMGFSTVVCGGVGENASSQGQTIRIIAVSDCGYQVTGTVRAKDASQSMLFMIGSSAVRDGSDILVVGGGATCFSMGTFWELGIYRLRLADNVAGRASWGSAIRSPTASNIGFIGSHKLTAISQNESANVCGSSATKVSVSAVPRIRLNSAEQFHMLLRDGKPVIIEDLDLGECLQKWSPGYMVEQVGSETKVVVHECHRDSEKMDFNVKNFSYVTDGFGSIMARAQTGARLYLRALSQDRPSELPAKMEDDFPRLAADFSLPPELDYVKKNIFSSVLRVSGRVNMWLHYDVMANVYTQILGSKRMIIFPPSDVRQLSFAPGASSSSLDVFSALDTASPSLAGTRPQEAVLGQGDTLLLPPLWLHTATPTTDMSVAVNVFFRDLDSGHYSAGRDVYGNRDLEAYEKGRQAAARIVKSFGPLPAETKRFYLARIADELLQGAEEG